MHQAVICCHGSHHGESFLWREREVGSADLKSIVRGETRAPAPPTSLPAYQSLPPPDLLPPLHTGAGGGRAPAQAPNGAGLKAPPLPPAPAGREGKSAVEPTGTAIQFTPVRARRQPRTSRHARGEGGCGGCGGAGNCDVCRKSKIYQMMGGRCLAWQLILA